MLTKSYDKISTHPITSVCVDDSQRKIFVGNLLGHIGKYNFNHFKILFIFIVIIIFNLFVLIN